MTTSAARPPPEPGPDWATGRDGQAHRTDASADDGSAGLQVAQIVVDGYVVDWQLPALAAEPV